MMASDNEINVRLGKINEIKGFLKNVEGRILTITKELNWDYEKLNRDKGKMVTCLVNPQHRVPPSELPNHEEKCKWIKDGYSETDISFPEFPGGNSFVTFTPELQTAVIGNAASKSTDFKIGNFTAERSVPKTTERLQQDFTRDERLAMYDYVIANTHRDTMLSDFSFLNAEERKEKKEMTALELAAAERDAKRRRASYRNKVHTNNKTQTEILREVIESQMDILKEEVTKVEKHHREFSRTESGDSSSHREKSKKKHKNKDRKKHHSHKKHKHKKRSTSRSRHKKHKRSVSRSRSRERHRKSP